MARKKGDYKETKTLHANKDRFLTEQMNKLKIDGTGASKDRPAYPAPQATVANGRRRLPGNTCG